MTMPPQEEPSISHTEDDWGEESFVLSDDKDGSSRSNMSNSITSLTMTMTDKAAKRAARIRKAHANRQAGLRRQRSCVTDEGSHASAGTLGAMRTTVSARKAVLPKNPPRGKPSRGTRRSKSSKSTGACRRTPV